MTGRSEQSLLPGRSTKPLDENKQRSVTNTFVGLDREAPFEYDPSGRTRFVVQKDEFGEDVGIIYFGTDVYPGGDVSDPNSDLSMRAAVAHELSHFHRWVDGTELPDGVHRDLDEAQTSLDAALRFANHLSPHDIQQLIRDSMKRLQLHRKALLLDEGNEAACG